MKIEAWKNGLKNGIPIFMGYFAVSFTFGIIAKQAGFNPFEAVFMSATNLTSAGQFAGLTLIATGTTIIQIALSQLIINSRYFLMSFALSQKIDPDTPALHRLIMAFGVSVAQKGRLNPYFMYGVMSLAIPGWALGTLFGVISGNVLPERLTSALSIALYGMLLAVIIPPAKGNKIIAGLSFISMVISLGFTKLPTLSAIAPGVKIIVLTLIIASTAAFFFPVKENTNE